ncbi:DUF6221 family protein [Nocardia brasiliensis]|uniref:DUF6221 family protein n=1 Tax=Nocardia brasiliensis TaxID=37326 RepID=UPI002458F49B|nr:DUF6221 family protein [Nocardia brasiliensis]
MTIEEFIAARVDELEQDAHGAVAGEVARLASDGCPITATELLWGPGSEEWQEPFRVVAAYRALLRSVRLRIWQAFASNSAVHDEQVRLDLMPLAAIWSDHPDYRREWA